MKNESYIPMPVKGRPYHHQQQAFEFVTNVFGLTNDEYREGVIRKSSINNSGKGCALLMEM